VRGAPPTTPAALALNHLDQEIADIEEHAVAGDPDASTGLIPRYLTRAQFLGRPSDLVFALTAAKRVVTVRPGEPAAHAARARVLTEAREIDAALKELAEAKRLGMDTDEVTHARVSILLAAGREDEAAAALNAKDDSPVGDLISAGAIEARRGHPAESDRWFELARTRYHDTSPLAVAWMDEERAHALVIAGDQVRARRYLAEAVGVLPVYARAVVRLASMQSPDDALALLRPLEHTSDDPEVVAAEGEALLRAGNKTDAADALTVARGRYEQLLRQLPRAYAESAAVFFLHAGGNPARALDLAKGDAAQRPTDETVDLWLRAAQASARGDEMCAAAKRALALAHPTASLRERATQVAASCH
jgi:tetratricopeptide (TPR) repeat protein